MPEVVTLEGAPGSFKLFECGVAFAGWKLVGLHRNGQPFNNGRDPALGYVIEGNAMLTLQVMKGEVYDYSLTDGGGGTHYPFKSVEIRSWGYYGDRCYSTCMRPSEVSGACTSFYPMSRHLDTPGDVRRENNDIHNVTDIEFIGKSGGVTKTNFFSHFKYPSAYSGSGHEKLHDLGFDATARFAAYEFKWTLSHIAWYVNGPRVRVEWEHEIDQPRTVYSTIPSPRTCGRSTSRPNTGPGPCHATSSTQWPSTATWPFASARTVGLAAVLVCACV